jgi:hypothetical protein
MILWSALLGVVGACASAAPAPAYASDPRIELLGVVQYLSGERPELPSDDAYRKAVEGAFGRWRGHPAVALWREDSRRLGGMNGRGIDLLYCTDPPELARKPGPWQPPYLDDPAEAERFEALLAALRDFARKSGFSAFFSAHRADYERATARAAAEFGVAEPFAAVQKYVGLPLDADARWIVSPLFVPSHRNAYITPYPDPVTLPDPGAARFSVVTLVAYAPGRGPVGDVVTQRHRAALWQEPLFVFVDPALRAFDEARGGGLESYYGAEVAECRSSGADCAKNWLVAALSARLDAAAFGAPTNLPDGRDPRRDAYMLALSERLIEYEKDRARWPTLWEFLPRLMAVFPEKAGLKPAPAPAPAPARSVRDLFPGRRAAETPR